MAALLRNTPAALASTLGNVGLSSEKVNQSAHELGKISRDVSRGAKATTARLTETTRADQAIEAGQAPTTPFAR